MSFDAHQQELDAYYQKQVGGRQILWKDKYKPYLSLYRDRLFRRNGEIERALPSPLERAVDVGCGQGDILVMLAAKAAKVIGLDYSTVMVETARENLKAFPNVEVLCSPAEELPFPDQFVDVLILADVIEHLVDPAGCIRECWRVLRPGGRLIITTPNAIVERFWKRFDGALNAPFRWIRRKKPESSVLEHLYEPAGLSALVAAQDFRIAEHRMIEFYPGSEGAGVFGRFLRLFARERHVRELLIEPVFHFIFDRVERLERFNNRQFLVAEKPGVQPHGRAAE